MDGFGLKVQEMLEILPRIALLRSALSVWFFYLSHRALQFKGMLLHLQVKVYQTVSICTDACQSTRATGDDLYIPGERYGPAVCWGTVYSIQFDI